MTEDMKVVKSHEDISNNLGTHENTAVHMNDIAVHLEKINVSVEGLVERVNSLEKWNQCICNENDLFEGTGEDKSRTGPQVPQPTQEEQLKTNTLAVDHNSHTQAEPENLLNHHMEVREEIFTEGKFQYMPKDFSKITSHAQTQAFRYDTDKNGNLVFSVFRGSSKLFEELYKLCDPANYGQVNEREGRLEIADLNPLLRAHGRLKALETELNGDKSNEPKLKELRALLQLYQEKDGQFSHLCRAQQRLDEMLRTGKWDWKSLKGLFYIGQLVVFRELRDEWAVARVTMVSSNDDSEYDVLLDRVQLQLECQAFDFDGKTCRAHVYRKTIPQFAGTMNITELLVYPLQNSPDMEKIWKDSITSGLKWKTLIEDLSKGNDGQRRVVVRQYQGYCETFGENANDEDKGGKGSVLAGRVIIDPSRFPDRLLRFTKDNGNPFNSNIVSEEDLVLCPEQVLVHSLSDNQWYYVAMSRLEEPRWDRDAWRRLVKPKSIHGVGKSINRIKDLAKAHKLQKSAGIEQNMNNFKGKGKGLTFLLHGSPGVGKTMLAECLSEDQERPLYRINLGRLVGDNQWESRIEEIFRQAHLWDAILLVDEAEVILAERTQENMHQSAWVAVFLRKVEYFEGIIFLTTNLIHMIDPAFISRVNLGIKIPDLDSDTRLEIWEKVLEENTNGGQKLSTQKNLLKSWANQELNGRQIRNVVLSASLMASIEKVPIQRGHILESLNDVLSFQGMIVEEKKSMEQKFMSSWS